MSLAAKNTLLVITAVCVILAGMSWVLDLGDHPGVPDENNAPLRLARLGGNILAGGLLVLLAWTYLRPDILPDFLKGLRGRRMERDGLCLLCAGASHEGVFTLMVFFQNRHTGRCLARVILSPISAYQLDVPLLELDCPGGGFGVALVPWLVPPESRGHDISFRLFSRPEYPEGRGRMVRFRDGFRLVEGPDAPFAEPPGFIPLDRYDQIRGAAFRKAADWERRAEVKIPVDAAVTGQASVPPTRSFILWAPPAGAEAAPPDPAKEQEIREQAQKLCAEQVLPHGFWTEVFGNPGAPST